MSASIEIDGRLGLFGAMVFIFMGGIDDPHAHWIHPIAILFQPIQVRGHEDFPFVLIRDAIGKMTHDVHAVHSPVTTHASSGEHGGGHNFVAGFYHRIVGLNPNQFRSRVFGGNGSAKLKSEMLASRSPRGARE
jgi:hypothetical protein